MAAVDVVLYDTVLQDADVAPPHSVGLVHRDWQVAQINTGAAEDEVLEGRKDRRKTVSSLMQVEYRSE